MMTRNNSILLRMTLLVCFFILRPMGIPLLAERSDIKSAQDELGQETETSSTLHRCATYKSPEDVDADEKEFSAKMISLSKSGTPVVAGRIQVYFHVINVGSGLKNGEVPESVIQHQLQVLNSAYRETGWTFALAGIDRTLNPDWFVMKHGDYKEAQMKTTLRKGGAGDLNVYLVGRTEGILGWATFPGDYERSPKMDGVVILFSSMPSVGSPPFHLGATLVHETGHWLGLYHTFQNGCVSSPTGGDQVADTPAEAQPHFGSCQQPSDTCPSVPGVDPISNYMDYSDDICLKEFTRGQSERMKSQYFAYRKTGVTPVPPPANPALQPYRVIVRVTDRSGTPLEGSSFAVFKTGASPKAGAIEREDSLLLGRTNREGIFDSKTKSVFLKPGKYRIRVVCNGYRAFDGERIITESSQPGTALLIFRMAAN